MNVLTNHQTTQSILVIGCGRMGSAIVNGWINDGVAPESIHIIDPNIEQVNSLSTTTGIVGYSAPEQIPSDIQFDVVLMALKPQLAPKVLPAYLPYISDNTLLVSIAAGLTIERLSGTLSGHQAIIRVMPNTPALVNQGVMAGIASAAVSAEQKQQCEKLFTCLGEFYWLEQEEQMHAVTAVSGSGPAYLFHFAESMISAAEQAGLSPDLARQLALKTITGAAHLVEQSQKSVSELRQEVTSPNGTTEAALSVLMTDSGLSHLVNHAVTRAAERSVELASE